MYMFGLSAPFSRRSVGNGGTVNKGRWNGEVTGVNYRNGQQYKTSYRSLESLFQRHPTVFQQFAPIFPLSSSRLSADPKPFYSRLAWLLAALQPGQPKKNVDCKNSKGVATHFAR